MKTIPEIHAEIERLSEVRGELWQTLSYGRQQTVVDEIKQIDEQLVALWDEHRAERARIASASATRSCAGHARKSAWSAQPDALAGNACGRRSRPPASPRVARGTVPSGAVLSYCPLRPRTASGAPERQVP